jgi:putative DNA primase/helicase
MAKDIAALRKAAVGLAKPFVAPNGGEGLGGEEKSPWKLALLNGAEIEPERVSWLWPGWLARGKFHVLAGAPGAGKTTLALKMAATVSAGSYWPDGTKATKGKVVIWSGEDDPADTIIPRLEASGADLSMASIVGPMTCGGERRPFDPSKDIAALKAAIEAGPGGCDLLIVDPVVLVASGDSHKNSETRRSLQPLVELATALDAALLGVHHFTKGSEGRSPIDGPKPAKEVFWRRLRRGWQDVLSSAKSSNSKLFRLSLK